LFPHQALIVQLLAGFLEHADADVRAARMWQLVRASMRLASHWLALRKRRRHDDRQDSKQDRTAVAAAAAVATVSTTQQRMERSQKALLCVLTTLSVRCKNALQSSSLSSSKLCIDWSLVMSRIALFASHIRESNVSK
jgi:hypothetical protein